MSKKHFIALANAVRALRPTPDQPTWDYAEATLQWERFRDGIARFCASQNPNFKRDRWIAYINGECGPNGGAIKTF